MNSYYILNKPYGYLSQFTDEGRFKGLSHLINVASDIYPVGRLDADSEGLLILTNDNTLKNQLLEPANEHTRTYAVQVEGMVDTESISRLKQSVQINVNGKLYKTKPAKNVLILKEVNFPERIPPIRFRKTVPTSWIQLSLTEGKNRQVRKMTAAIGFPTLRLIRVAIEDLHLENINAGEVVEMDKKTIYKLLKLS